MNGLYTIQTNNVNALVDYVYTLGHADHFSIQPYLKDGQVWHSVTFTNIALSSLHILRDVHLCSRYQLGGSEASKQYTIKDENGVVLDRFDSLFYAVYSIKERSIKGLVLFGCMPWDNIPITEIQVGKLQGMWFTPIWEDRVSLSKERILSCSLFDFSLQPLAINPDLRVVRKASRIVLALGNTEMYELVAIQGFIQ